MTAVNLGEAVGFVAPYYNLVLVLILVMVFIIFLRKTTKKVYKTPWKFLFAALMVYIIEEILTVLQGLNIITLSRLIAPILEMIIISLFIYMVFLQRDYLVKNE